MAISALREDVNNFEQYFLILSSGKLNPALSILSKFKMNWFLSKSSYHPQATWRSTLKRLASLVAPSLKSGATFLLTSVFVWLFACSLVDSDNNFSYFQNFVKFSKIPEPKYVSGHSEQLCQSLWFFVLSPFWWILLYLDSQIISINKVIKNPWSKPNLVTIWWTLFTDLVYCVDNWFV